MGSCPSPACLGHRRAVSWAGGGCSTSLTQPSSMLVFLSFQPVAAGSGIPQIKCFLNGVKIPHVVRLKVRPGVAGLGAVGLPPCPSATDPGPLCAAHKRVF